MILFHRTVATTDPLIIDRYAIFDEIASGGMATVHLGRLLGSVGFSRTVAIKRLHPQFAKDPEFVSMFVDEARVAARIRHPNVVPTIDVVRTDTELFLVMEYVQGESLARLLKRARHRGRRIDINIVLPVMAAVLHGLHAAHTASGERGEPLHIVHRDVSPQNVLVGIDGVARVFDFGVAKARGRLQTTREGQIKGKLAYMAPEQLAGEEVGPTTDVYAATAVLWEALAGRRLFNADTEAALVGQVIRGVQEPPSVYNDAVTPELDELVLRGLHHEPDVRFPSAREMAVALERIDHPKASATEIGEWVEDFAADSLLERADRVADIESMSEVKVLGERISSRGRLSRPGDGADGEEATRITNPGSIYDSNSQLSSISVVSGSSAGDDKGPARWLVAVLALLIGGVAAVVLLDRDPQPERGPPVGDAKGAAPGPSSPPMTPSVMPSAARTAPPAATGEPDDSPPAAPPPVPTAPAPSPPVSKPPLSKPPVSKPHVPTPRVPPIPPKAPPPNAHCDPPFYFDAEGIKHYKPQCL